MERRYVSNLVMIFPNWGGERQLYGKFLNDRAWPGAARDRRNMNDRYRSEATVNRKS